MFRTAEIGRTVSKEDYDLQVPELRAELLLAQQRLRDVSFPVVVVFGGVDGAGKSETINLLNAWLDPRWIITRAYGPPSDEMRERPEFWRYWRDLPPNGRIGLFQSSWYHRHILDHVYERTTEPELDEALERISTFERTLADGNALILKFWMHLGKKAQKRRLEQLEKDPLTSWRVKDSDRDHLKRYDAFVATAERTIMRTSNGQASWHIVEGFDERYRSLTVGRILLESLHKHFDEIELMKEAKAAREAKQEEKLALASDPAAASTLDKFASTGVIHNGSPLTILSGLNMEQKLEKKEYKHQLEHHLGRLNKRARQAQEQGISTIVVFEGWDAAGKGGAIRRLVSAIDARATQIIPIAAPTDEEMAHHYLWRFWRHLSRAGRFTIFDRSWYGRVLVERVEGFATESEWKRSYAEINDFEDQIVRHGIVLCKFWLHITKEEQLERFEERKRVPYKSWKLTDEDWRNREKWDEYELAVNDMVERTSTTFAPWTIVEANDKRLARVKVLETISDQLKSRLKQTEDRKK